MADVAASGGYYVAAPCTKIVALPATMTGSIGVIMETIEYHKLMSNLGVESNTLTSGPHKDMGSRLRAMTPEDEKLFRAMIDDVYDQFVEAVAEGRQMDKAAVKKLADGRVYTGRQALEAGLIDELGTFHESIMLAASEAGIKGEPTVRFIGRMTLLDVLTSEVEAAAPLDPASLLLLDSRLMSMSKALTDSQTPTLRLE